MFKRMLLLLLAAALTVGAHLRPCWEFCPEEGEPISCSPHAARLAIRAAEAAAEEILPGQAALPPLVRKLRLTLGRREEDPRLLADALLRRTEGVFVRDEVSVDGRRLGFVADGAALRDTIGTYIANTLPTWACGGVLSREFSVRRCYTREGRLTPDGDMLLLITGMAPVFYFDGMGKYARA